jgi:hypothetical protein
MGGAEWTVCPLGWGLAPSDADAPDTSATAHSEIAEIPTAAFKPIWELITVGRPSEGLGVA